MSEIQLNTIEEAIEDFREGKFLIVVDDEDRENEGDFIIAAEKVTPEKINFMLKNGRGVLCAPITEERCQELELDMQVANNTSLLGTPFTITVDKLGGKCTTGVSMYDRAETILALADPKTKPSDLGRPGHINPLRARSRGVLRRSLDRDHQRGWNHGTSAAINRGSQEIRYKDYLYQGPDRLSPPHRIDRGERRRGRSPYQVRTFPSHSFPPEKQWLRTYSFDKG